MEKVSLLKDANVRYAAGTELLVFAAASNVGRSITQPVVDGWIACADELPPIETEVLVLVKGKRRVGSLEWDVAGPEDSFKSYQYWEDSENHYDWEWDDVTHWQHLPPARVL